MRSVICTNVTAGMARTRRVNRVKVPHPPPPSSEAVSLAMRGNRQQSTGPEIRLRRLLQSANLKRFLVNAPTLPGRPDLAFPADKVAIFVNGCFWHRCPRHGRSLPMANRNYWKVKFRLNQERDLRKERELRGAEWRVVTIWECEIRTNPDLCVRRVQSALSEGPSVATR
jgi:DNA mismatch endonuclease, patch repair protein